MRGFVGWINHRDTALANLDALLLMYPRGRQFAGDFPDLKAVLRQHFDDGVSAASSALQVGEKILGNFLQQLDDQGRTALREALIATGRAGFGKVADRRVRGERDDPRDPVLFATQLTGVALFMAARMAKEGVIGRADYDGFLQRIAVESGGDSSEQETLRVSFTP